MKNKIILIQPKNTLSLNIYPPLNLIKIGSALQVHGYEVKIIPAPITDYSTKLIIEECKDSLLVGIGVLTAEMSNAISIAQAVKEEYTLPIVWGGWHATLFPEQMTHSKLVDHVIVDEGDDLIVQIANYYKNNGCKSDTDFIGSKILENQKKLNLDTLAEPDYGLVPNLEYYMNIPLTDKFLEYDSRIIKWLPYEASRGCPSKCTFCINTVTDNRKYRRKSSQKVINEIESLVDKHNINHLKIIDDNFFVNVKWVKEIAKGLIQKGLDITWDAECRVDYFNGNHVNHECLELCVASGMNELNFGIESGSQRSLDIVKKEITPEQALNAVKTASKFGIVSRCSFIIDIPGERKEDIFKTVQLVNKIREIPKTTCGIHTYRPYPRSELCEEMLRNGEIKQPEAMEGWADEQFIEQFTYTDAKRKWQKNYRISSKISYYQSLESGMWLKPHQIKNRIVSSINSFFVKVAHLRNKYTFYTFTLDRYLYIYFKNLFYRFQERR